MKLRESDLAENEKVDKAEPKKHGLTGWLKLKFMGSSKDETPVDDKFLDDVSEIQKVDRYEISEKVGQGSMGVVYLARDPYIDRDVAIKISRPSANVVGKKAEKYRQSFFNESQSVGKLMHPNIVSVYDVGVIKDFCYMTMEFIDGPTLKKFCQKDYLLPISNVVQIVFMACKALDYAHRQGVIHRDIKPANLMINKAGYVKITDFGIAKIKSDQTASQGLVGSPSYMSPEQVKDQAVDDKSDIFSLGCVLYALLTGELAFPGDNHFSIMYKIAREDPVPIREIRPEIPEILDRIVSKSLAKEAGDRYQNCSDFAYDLRVALRGLKGTIKSSKIGDVVDYVHTVPFFEDFSKSQVREILKASNLVKVKKGKIVVAEGEIDDSFFIILSGKAVVKKNDKEIALIGRGECFGEMSYLSGQARAATVVAETDCNLIKISATLLDKASKEMQLLFLKTFAMTLIERLSKKIRTEA
jgi:eukaryotic-like serine/threonine-protein kinase